MSRNFLTPIVLPAGTTSSAPLNLQAGTNLSTEAAGAFEYDGRVIYSTPSGRGVSPSMMFYRLNSDLAGANSTAVQSIFGVGVTLASSTVYAFEILCAFSKTVGATSHTFALSFGGTATANNFLMHGIEIRNTTAFPQYISSTNTIVSASLASAFTATALASAVLTRVYSMRGTLSVNAGGTLIPRYQLSAAPGGAYSTVAGSYFAIWPIGAAGANTSVGPWA
jgi:hypothetical protein